MGNNPTITTTIARIQESGVRMFEELLNYQTGIFAVSLKKLTVDACSCSVPLGIS
jgi:hypothetical protein